MRIHGLPLSLVLGIYLSCILVGSFITLSLRVNTRVHTCKHKHTETHNCFLKCSSRPDIEGSKYPIIAYSPNTDLENYDPKPEILPAFRSLGFADPSGGSSSSSRTLAAYVYVYIYIYIYMFFFLGGGGPRRAERLLDDTLNPKPPNRKGLQPQNPKS